MLTQEVPNSRESLRWGRAEDTVDDDGRAANARAGGQDVSTRVSACQSAGNATPAAVPWWSCLRNGGQRGIRRGSETPLHEARVAVHALRCVKGVACPFIINEESRSESRSEKGHA